MRFKLKHHEFWHPRLFELPYYCYLGLQCLINRISIKSLAKANYNLDHGEIGIGSKYESQMAFNQEYFLPTCLIKRDLSNEEKKAQILDFAKIHNFPVILKSDVGCVGKGILTVHSEQELNEKVNLLLGDSILQKFTDFSFECGIFFARHQQKATITGVNIKHFPEVIGNGRDSIMALAKAHYRFSHHWHSFLQYLDTTRVPKEGERVQLSFIGSHTLGCKFTDDTQLLTPALEKAIFDVFEDQPGFNFGRVDVKSADQEALLKGNFVVIEVNGIASLPTHMFDPKYSLVQAYKIFFQHAKLLVSIAKEHKNQTMNLLPIREVIKRAKNNQSLLNDVHDKLKS